VHPEPPRSRAAGEIAGLEEMSVVGGRTVETQRQLLNNPELYFRAGQKVGVNIEESTSFQFRTSTIKDTDVVLIQVTEGSSDRAARLAQAAAEQHVEDMQSGWRNTARRAVEFIGQQLNGTQTTLENLENSIRDYKVSHGVVDLPQERTAQTQALSQLESQTASAVADSASASGRTSELREELAQQAKTYVQSSTISRNPVVQQLELELSDLESKRAEQSPLRGDSHPEIVKLDDRIASVKRRLATAVEQMISSKVQAPNPVHEDLAKELALAEANARAAYARTSALRGVTQTAKSQMSRIPYLESELGRLERDKAVTQEVYSLLLSKLQEMQIQEAMTPPIVEIIRPAEPPLSPVKPRKALNLAIALVLGLILSALGVGAAEMLDDSIRTSWQAQDELRLPSLGVVPHVPRGASLLTAPGVSPAIADAFASLLSNLRYVSPGGLPSAILVTSGRLGDGKTTVACNLAAMLAQTSSRVLLVGADLRNPDTHALAGAKGAPGLSEALSGLADPMACCHATSSPNLFVLPAGGSSVHPVNLLGSPQMESLVTHLRGAFDNIILDAPSCDHYPDPVLLARLCDATLLVVKVGATPMRVAGGAIDKLGRAERIPLGIVCRMSR
jgi:tyrosine-protein kinase Etk/Wzc